MDRQAPENTRPHRGMRLTPKGVAAGCLLAAAKTEGVGEAAAELAGRLGAQMMDGAAGGPLLPEVRRLRRLLGEHPFGAKLDRDALPWFEEQAAGAGGAVR